MYLAKRRKARIRFAVAMSALLGFVLWCLIAAAVNGSAGAITTSTTVSTVHHSSCSAATGECYDPVGDYGSYDAPAGDSHGWDY